MSLLHTTDNSELSLEKNLLITFMESMLEKLVSILSRFIFSGRGGTNTDLSSSPVSRSSAVITGEEPG